MNDWYKEYDPNKFVFHYRKKNFYIAITEESERDLSKSGIDILSLLDVKYQEHCIQQTKKSFKNFYEAFFDNV